MQVQTKTVSELFDVTTVTIGNWVKSGCPKVRRGTFELRAVMLWWAENIYETKIETGETDDTLKNARQRYWQAKAEKEEINIAQLRKSLIPKKELAQLWGARVTEVRQGLINLTDRLPPILVSKSQSEIRDIVHRETTQLLKIYSRESKNTPKPKKSTKQAKPKKQPKKKKAKRASKK